MTAVSVAPGGRPTSGRLGRRLARPLAGTGVAGVVSAFVIAVAALAAIVGPLVAPYNPTVPDTTLQFVGPAGAHLLGFDVDGRDVLSRLLAGAQSSMAGPLAVVVISLALGTALAVTSAWRRGATDATVSAALDILFAFPGILLAVLATAVFGPGLTAASVALAIAYVPYVARVLRGAALKERSQPYVDALSVQGLSGPAICLRHIVPNMASLIVAQATIMFGWAMVDLAAISFLGLGVQAPAPNWGVMISENAVGLQEGYPLPTLAAGACVVIVVIAFNVLGERLLARAARS
jgi:peptide/nickel transport system permease protein